MPALTVAQVLSGGALGATAPFEDLLVSEIGGTRVVYALNRAENTLVQFSSSASGDLVLGDTLQFSGTIPAGTSARLGLGEYAGGQVFLTISGLSAQDGQQVLLSPTGGLGAQSSLAGVTLLEAQLSLMVAGSPVLVSGNNGGGLLAFADSGSGYAPILGLADTSARYLADVAASVGFSSNGTHYIASVSATEHGVNVASVSQTGLSQTGGIGAESGLPVGQPSDIAVVSHLGETWLAVASQASSSLSTLRVDDGQPYLTDHIIDTPQTRFQGASQVAAIAYGDLALVVAGGTEGGLSLLTMLPGGRLVHLASLADDETVPLDQVSALELSVEGSTLDVFATSSNEIGLTRVAFDLSQFGLVSIAPNDTSGASGTSLDDQIIGSAASESLTGEAGADILLDGHGIDTLSGGSGADLFVMTADGQADYITDFEPGLDRLDLSAFDFFSSLSQLTILPNGTGATLSIGAEVIEVTTSDLSPLTSAQLSYADVFNVDRPPLLMVGRDVIGSSNNETLNGGAGNDTISGFAGHDLIAGGAGVDLLLGGVGNDTVSGDAAGDTLYGGAGNDLLQGGDGNDVIYGDDWA